MKTKFGMVLLICFIVVLLPIFAEAIIYPGIVLNYFGFGPLFLALAGFFVAVLMRIFVPKKIWQQLPIMIYFVMAPLLTLLALIFRVADLNTHANFSYTTFHIDPVAAGMVALYIILAGLPLIDRNFLTKHFKAVFAAASLFAYHLLITYWSNPPLFYYLEAEDKLVEYLTCVFYFVGAIFAFMCLKYVKKLKLNKNQITLIRVLLLVSAIGMFVITAEEISWGQRILQIETPESIAVTNTQKELNLHNNGFIFGYIYLGYLILNAFFLLNWVVYDLTKNKLPRFWEISLRLITSRWYLTLLFIPNLVYAWMRLNQGNIFIDQWEEITEIYTALGIALIWILNYKYFQKKSTRLAEST
jgi:hypothetical protein